MHATGVPPPTATIFGSPFLTWRGVPIIPSDKLTVNATGKSNILLLRTGEKRQGVVGPHARDVGDRSDVVVVESMTKPEYGAGDQ